MAAKLAFYAWTSTTTTAANNIQSNTAVATAQTEKKRISLAFYVGQTKKEYTNKIKEDLQTIDNSVATLESGVDTLNTRINTKVQTVNKEEKPLEKTQNGDYIFQIIK